MPTLLPPAPIPPHTRTTKGASKFGFHLLTEPGMSLHFTEQDHPEVRTTAFHKRLNHDAHGFAVRAGWKLSVRRQDDGSIRVWRLHSPGQSLSEDQLRARLKAALPKP